MLDLRPWGVPAGAIAPAERGTNNATYLVHADGQPRWVLRLSQNVSVAQVRAEHRLLRRLSACGLPFAVPSPVELLAGGTVLETAGGPAVLHRWIPGVRPGLSDAGSMRAAGRAFGQLDAAMRSVPARDAPHDWRKNPLTGADEVCAELSALSVPFVDVLAAVAARISPVNLPAQVVHGDLGAGNMLVDPETGAVTGVLDFEIAGTALRIEELAVALRQTGALRFDERWPALTAALVRGYCTACPLTPGEIQAVPGLLLSRAVGSILWRTGRWRRGQATLREVEDRLARLDGLDRWLDSHHGQLLDVLSAAAFGK